VTGGMGGDDLLTAGPEVMPGALTDWMRRRPTGAVLNLMRKELRLLRPLWLISLLAALGWACLTLFGLLYERGYSRNFETAVVIVGVISTLMIAILAGSLSLGEEKTSGTHAWNLTLPVSARRQWGVKLLVALFAGFVGAGLLPMLTVGRLPHLLFDLNLGTRWLVVVFALTFAAFWCACAVDGTVAAALWVIPVMIVLGGASYLAGQGVQGMILAPLKSGPLVTVSTRTNWLVAKVDKGGAHIVNLLGNFRFDWWVATAVNRHIHTLILLEHPMFYAALVGGPALILALFQSYRLFRAQDRSNSRSLIRNLLPLALLVFLCGLSLTAFNAFWWQAGGQVNYFTAVTGYAIQKALPAAAKLHPTEPLQLTGDDVANAWRWPLIDKPVRRWLSGARVTVTPDKAHAGSFFCPLDPWGHTQCYFSATVHLADGTDVFLSSDPPTNDKFRWGRFSVRARWPGGTTEETLWDR